MCAHSFHSIFKREKAQKIDMVCKTVYVACSGSSNFRKNNGKTTKFTPIHVIFIVAHIRSKTLIDEWQKQSLEKTTRSTERASKTKVCVCTTVHVHMKNIHTCVNLNTCCITTHLLHLHFSFGLLLPVPNYLNSGVGHPDLLEEGKTLPQGKSNLKSGGVKHEFPNTHTHALTKTYTSTQYELLTVIFNQFRTDHIC